jgi:hypothetical protein
MSRRQIIAVIVVLGVVGTIIGSAALTRMREARQFSEKHRVENPTGTNFVVQLVETTVGRVETGYVVIAYARFENLNSLPLVLPRESFVLIDGTGRKLTPVTSGTQTPLINLSGNGVLEKEALSFAVDNRALDGTLTLEVGHQTYLLVKNSNPWMRPLPVGQFVTFRSWSW